MRPRKRLCAYRVPCPALHFGETKIVVLELIHMDLPHAYRTPPRPGLRKMDCAKTANKYQGCGNSNGGNQSTNHLGVQALPLIVNLQGQTLLRWHAKDLA